MPRIKTRLTPEDQWLKTARYVPRNNGKFNALEWWLRRFAEDAPPRPRLSDLFLRELWREKQCDQLYIGADGSEATVGIIVRPHRMFGVGDVLRITRINGWAQRYLVRGVSSKGVRTEYKYVKLHNGAHNGAMQWHDVPSALIGYRWDDPAVCRFVKELRAEFIGS
jgi:hypothetical protein